MTMAPSTIGDAEYQDESRSQSHSNDPVYPEVSQMSEEEIDFLSSSPQRINSRHAPEYMCHPLNSYSLDGPEVDTISYVRDWIGKVPNSQIALLRRLITAAGQSAFRENGGGVMFSFLRANNLPFMRSGPNLNKLITSSAWSQVSRAEWGMEDPVWTPVWNVLHDIKDGTVKRKKWTDIIHLHKLSTTYTEPRHTQANLSVQTPQPSRTLHQRRVHQATQSFSPFSSTLNEQVPPSSTAAELHSSKYDEPRPDSELDRLSPAVNSEAGKLNLALESMMLSHGNVLAAQQHIAQVEARHRIELAKANDLCMRAEAEKETLKKQISELQKQNAEFQKYMTRIRKQEASQREFILDSRILVDAGKLHRLQNLYANVDDILDLKAKPEIMDLDSDDEYAEMFAKYSRLASIKKRKSDDLHQTDVHVHGNSSEPTKRLKIQNSTVDLTNT